MPARPDIDVLIVGAGHAGLFVAHQLQRAGRDVVLIDRHARVGDAWRARWDSLRLFTPRFADELPAMPFPAAADPFPNKDEVADYQEAYARERGFVVRLGEDARSLRRSAEGFDVETTRDRIRATSVVVAAGNYTTPRIPPFAENLDPSVLQLHSSEYRRPSQLPEGPVVVVGAANSGGEIAADVAPHQRVGHAVKTRDERLVRVRTGELEDEAEQQQDLEHGEEQGHDVGHREDRRRRRRARGCIHVRGSRGRDRPVVHVLDALDTFGGSVVVHECHAQTRQQGSCQAANLPSVDAFPFAYRQRVRFGETDLQKVVYYANYLVYAEVGRVAYLR